MPSTPKDNHSSDLMKSNLNNLTYKQIGETLQDVSIMLYQNIRDSLARPDQLKEIHRLRLERTRIAKVMIESASDRELADAGTECTNIRSEYEVLQYKLKRQNKELGTVELCQLDCLNEDIKLIAKEVRKRYKNEQSSR